MHRKRAVKLFLQSATGTCQQLHGFSHNNIICSKLWRISKLNIRCEAETEKATVIANIMSLEELNKKQIL